MFWLVVSVHAGGNASVIVGDAWLETEDPSTPWLIRLGWTVSNHGVGLRWLLAVLLALALLIDARHLRDGDSGSDGPVLAVPFQPAVRATWWTTRLFPTADRGTAAQPGSWPRRIVAAFLLTGAYLWRDVQFLLQAHRPEPRESRRAAIGRGRIAMQVVREARAEGIARALQPAGALTRSRFTVRALGVLTAAGLTAAILWWAPHLAAGIGTRPSASGLLPHLSGLQVDWFAGLLDGLGDWWNGLPPWGKVAVGAGTAALVVLSGGSFGLALGISGAGTYLLGHAHGAADFATDPRRATRSYLRDPDAWWAAQRALRHDERGVIDLAAFCRRDPIRAR